MTVRGRQADPVVGFGVGCIVPSLRDQTIDNGIVQRPGVSESLPAVSHEPHADPLGVRDRE